MKLVIGKITICTFLYIFSGFISAGMDSRAAISDKSALCLDKAATAR